MDTVTIDTTQVQSVLDRLQALQQKALTPPVASGYPQPSRQSAELATIYLNEKEMFDDFHSDISFNRKSLFRHQTAWDALALSQAQMMAIAAHAINMNVVISAQTGDTSAQQTASPVRTAAGDSLAANASPANRVTDAGQNAILAGMVESVQTNVTTQVSALTQQVGVLTTTVVGLAQSVTDGNAAIAGALATMIAALTALKPTAAPTTGA